MALYLCARVALTLGLTFLTGTLAFYRPVACEEVSSLAHEVFSSLGKFPLTGMPAWVIALFSTAIPAGLAAWLPSMILLGRVHSTMIAAWPLVLPVVLCSLATYCFRRGLRYYAKHGSIRYKQLGHRR